MNEAEEQFIAVQTRATEHAPRTHIAQALELLEDKGQILRFDGHGSGDRNTSIFASSARRALASDPDDDASNAGARLQS